MKKFKTLVSFTLIISLAMALVVPTKAFADVGIPDIPWYIDDNYYNWLNRDGNYLGKVLTWCNDVIGLENRPQSELWTGTGAASVYNSSTTNYYTPISVSNQDYYYDIYNPVTNTYNTVNYTRLSYDPTYNSYYYDYEYNNYDYKAYVSYSDTYVIYNYICPEDPNQNKFFEVYFVLPDGRNSFNLTKDDLKGIVFSYDVDVYDNANVGSTLHLWHLDGSLVDSINNEINITTTNCSFVNARFDGGLQFSTSNIDMSTILINNLPDIYTIEFIFYIPQSLKNFSSYTSLGSTYYKNPLVSNLSVGYHYYSFDSTGQCFIDGVLQNNNYFVDYGNIVIVNDERVQFRSRSIVPMGTNGYVVYGMIFDEIRISGDILYAANYTPRNEPFDSGIGFVVPDNPIEQNIYMQSFVKPSVWQFGGIRNPNPENGEAYFALENNIVISAQQYLNGIWQEIPSAIYLDGSFHNLLGYDLTTLVYFGGFATSGSNFDVDLSTTNSYLKDIRDFLAKTFGYAAFDPDTGYVNDYGIWIPSDESATSASWWDVLLPLVYLLFVIIFLLQTVNAVFALITFLVNLIFIQPSIQGINEDFVLAFQWLRGETENPFYLFGTITCWDFMVVLFQIFFVGLAFAVIRKNVDTLNVSGLKKR